jgi:hypothetical protein
MLEDCPDLPACEIILSEAVKGVHLLGEIPLSDSDIEILANFVHQKISPSSSRGTATWVGLAPHQQTDAFAITRVEGRYFWRNHAYLAV